MYPTGSPQLLGRNRLELDQVDSTNTYAWQLVREAQTRGGNTLQDGMLIQAQHQYAGRGQRGTTWLAAPGENLTFSLVLYPRGVTGGTLFLLHKAFSLAVADALSELLGPQHPVQIKWPNDILVDGRKVCGMLIENQLTATHVEVTVLGIGLNVNQRVFPADLAKRATSLGLVTGEHHPLGHVLDRLLSHIEGLYLPLRNVRALDAGHTALLDHAYLQRLYRYQEWAPFQQGTERFQGMIVGVTRDGRLALQRSAGLRYYDFKEVVFG